MAVFWNIFFLGILLAAGWVPSYVTAATVLYDFESKQGFTAPSTSTLNVSGTRYKLGTHSLRWTWAANDVVSLNLTSHNIADKSVTQGGLKLWIYNEASIHSKCLTIMITKRETASSTSSCTGGSTITHTSEFRFSLAFAGWRAAWVGYSEFEHCPSAPARLPSCKYDQKQITMMQIQAPGIQGTVHIDALQFIDKMKSQSRDEIVPLIKCLSCSTLNSGVTEADALGLYKRSNFWQQTYRWGAITAVPVAPTLTETELAGKLSDVHLIEKRLVNWFADEKTTFAKLSLPDGKTYPDGVVTNNFYLRKRWDDLSDNINEAYEDFRALQITKSSGTPAVITGSPLFVKFSEYGNSKTDGGDRKFGNVMKALLPLALEYHLKSRPLEVSNTVCQWAKKYTASATPEDGDVKDVASQDSAMIQTFNQEYRNHVADNGQQPPDACVGADATSYSKVKHAITQINNKRKENLLLLFEYLKDQGWVKGSAAGSTSHEMNQSGAGFANAVFLFRKELEAAGQLESHIDTLKWYTDFNEIYQHPTYEYHGTTADRMRTILLFRLMAVLMMPEEAGSETTKPKAEAKIRDMENWRRWYNNILTVNKGVAGLIKPDYTGFHHHGYYGPAYVPHALHVAGISHYLIKGTSFSSDAQSDFAARENLKKALDVLKVVSVKYSTPNSISGRFPGYSRGILAATVAPFAYLAVSSPSFADGAETELGELGNLATSEAKTFLRLYDLGDEEDCGDTAGDRTTRALKQDLCEGRFRSPIRYYNSLGSLQIMQKVKSKADGQSLVGENSPTGHWAKNFAAMSIHRRDNWAVTMKGFNRFIWDTEMSSNENVFGLYQSHGALQISNSEDELKRLDVENGWDWTKIPGTTSIAFNFTDLLTISNNRRLNPKKFAGGVTFSGKDPYESSNGAFGMDFEQPSYKLTANSPFENVDFKFKKSVFFEDDLLLCLGSRIETENVANGAKTITTLFQNKFLTTDAPNATTGVHKCGVGSAKAPNDWGAVTSVVLEDISGNRYYVKDPRDNGLNFQPREMQTSFDSKGRTHKTTQGEYCTAWFDHGTNQQGKSYEYSVQVKGSAPLSSLPSASDYIILKNNEKVHAVKISKASSARPLFGYVVFGVASGTFPSGHDSGPISRIAKGPAIVMAQFMADNRLAISVSMPDLNLVKDTNAPSWCPNTFPALPTTASAFGDEYKFCAASAAIQVRVILKNDANPVSKIYVNGEDVAHPNMNANEDVKISAKRIDFRNLRNGFTTEVWFAASSTSP